MSLLTRRTLAQLRELYGSLWLVAVAEHWERHSSLEELRNTVDACEVRYR